MAVRYGSAVAGESGGTGSGALDCVVQCGQLCTSRRALIAQVLRSSAAEIEALVRASSFLSFKWAGEWHGAQNGAERRPGDASHR